ncbi:MAG: hypothetical protein H6757_07245 [Candidatus Omnitrophica bacterium]|nr:hypothetical protein [Candidatus Omnitrophota bacterium]
MKEKKFSLFDIFVVLFAGLALASVYFTFVHPIHFSKMIEREGVSNYADVEILLSEDLSWMKDVLPVGESFGNVYGNLDWKIMKMEEVVLSGRPLTKVTAKLMVTTESSGLIHYGKYTLVKGGKIFLINDDFFLEGRVYDFYVSDEKYTL